MIKNLLKYTLLTAFSAMIFMSCEKEFDSPPRRTIPEGFRLTVSDLKQIYSDSGEYTFDQDYSMYVTVTSNDVSGAFGKNGYVQDSTGGMVLRTVAYSALKEGDYIRVALNGTTISEYNGMPQIDELDTETNVIIQSTGQFVEPMLVTIDEIDPSIQGMLITIDSVEFRQDEIGQPFADAENGFSVDRILQDCDGNSVIVRTSGYADFADVPVPGRRGSFTGVVGQFGSTMQLAFSTLDDLDLTALRCDGTTGDLLLVKNFEDESISSGGWTQQVVIGSDDWYVDDFSNNFFAKVSNFNGSSNDPSEVWYISPALDLTSLNSPALSFLTFMNYAGPQLETYVSTDYGSVMDVEAATWNLLQANYSPGGWAEVPSGTISLAPYSSSATYVAFRYTGSSSDGSTWELDDIVIFDN